MVTKTLKTLTSQEIAFRLANLKAGETFITNTKLERNKAQHIAKTLRDAGSIHHTITSRTNDDGQFVFFIAP